MAYSLIIVPDVNVLVSGIKTSQYALFQIMQAWKNKKLEIVTSNAILEDFARVLTYPKIIRLTKQTPEQAKQYVLYIRTHARLVSGSRHFNISKDPTDDKLFDAALEAKASHIVTLDKKHVLMVPVFQGIRTIHPSDFVKEFLETV